MKLTLRAPAKLNLTLEVLGRRDDGFHQICGVTQAIGLFDTVRIEPAQGLELEAPAATGPTEENLVIRAAERLADETGQRTGARIELLKAIPVSAGLGGGSSDAAATLRLLNRLWETGRTAAQLECLAAALGSDVPFFLKGGTAEIVGRGERVEPLPASSPFWIVLVSSPWLLSRKTARVYGAVVADDYGNGSQTARLVARLRAGQSPRQQDLVNGLQPAALRQFPELARLIAKLEAAGGVQFGVSGAGPSLFHLAESRERAGEVAARVRRSDVTVRVVRSIQHAGRIRRS